MNRRRFIKTAGLAAAGLAAARGWGAAAKTGEDISIVVNPGDEVANAPPVQWAVGRLQAALAAGLAPGGFNCRIAQSVKEAGIRDLCVLVSGSGMPAAQAILAGNRVAMPAAAQSLCLAEGEADGRRVLLACGHDAPGLVYAVLELVDRSQAEIGGVPSASPAIVERPANALRSVMRSFVSEAEDKAWFHDREYWKRYLSMLAMQRINRFNLALGIGYNSARGVTDGYFVFPYPFFVTVPGHDVTAEGLSSEERDRNISMLRFISDETAARGMQFQLGLWTHAYEWPESPGANYRIRGLTPETHAPYCREGLAALIDACPAITGLTLRVHGESGIPDGNLGFWKTLFEAIPRSGQRIEIDMHAKGVPEETLELALATGMPVVLSPKYWGEHRGLPYHQAATRELERAHPGEVHETAEGLSGGSRRFTRYGYADLLAENRRYGVLHRIWPGTQRFLLWGDPATAAGYGRYSGFCGSLGAELMEPLSFKGRQGTGRAGGRCAYADSSLNPGDDFEKYLYPYRLWGRLTYNPGCDPEVWRRGLRLQFGNAAAPAERALALSSRILPLITTAHGLSGSNNVYWPEVYTNMPIVDPNRKHPYRDTPEPRVFGNVSAFDPQLFMAVNEFADRTLSGRVSAKYSPIDVAGWLEGLAGQSAASLAEAQKAAREPRAPEFRRWAEDARIQNAIGLFFAWKLRSGVSWRMHERSGERGHLEAALKAYRNARQAWLVMAEHAQAVYAADIAYGTGTCRGDWLDRLAAIDGDIADMEKKLEALPAGSAGKASEREPFTPPPFVECRHSPAERFERGRPLAIMLSSSSEVTGIRLRYRWVNQAMPWQAAEMNPAAGGYEASIPGEYTQTRYPLQYYFEVAGRVYPGFDADLSNLPYFVVRA